MKNYLYLINAFGKIVETEEYEVKNLEEQFDGISYVWSDDYKILTDYFGVVLEVFAPDVFDLNKSRFYIYTHKKFTQNEKDKMRHYILREMCKRFEG